MRRKLCGGFLGQDTSRKLYTAKTTDLGPLRNLPGQLPGLMFQRDFREPDNLRLGLAPLYTSFSDVWEGINRIQRVVEEKRYEKYPQEKLTVT